MIGSVALSGLSIIRLDRRVFPRQGPAEAWACRRSVADCHSVHTVEREAYLWVSVHCMCGSNASEGVNNKG